MKSIPKCHPNKKYGARGYCKVCYNKWLINHNPKYKEMVRYFSNKWGRTKEGKNCKLKSRYGITYKEVDEMKLKQNNKCLICEEEKPLIIEHCHSTGKIRGLTCQPCNLLIAQIEHKSHLISKVKEYLEVK